MKKLLYVLLAMTVAFAMTGCPTDGGDGGGGDTKYTVTFDLNGGTGDQPADRTIVKGRAIGALPEAPELTGKLFDGWVVGTTEITATYTVNGNITVKAAWFDPDDTKIKVKSYNPAGVTAAEVEIEFGTTTWNDIKSKDAFARPKWSSAVTGDAYEFAGWYDVSGDTGINGGNRLDSLNADDSAALPAIEAGTIIQARWASTAFNPPSDAILKMALENGGYALFEFTLPEGKKASDYASVTAEFMVPESSLYKQIRSFRLMGPYSETVFSGNAGNKTDDEGNGYAYTGDFTKDPNGLMIAKFDTENATAIAHDNGYGWGYNWAGLQGKASGTPAAANEWFTVTYPFNSTGKNPNNGFTGTRLDLTGKIYLGVGIPGPEAGYSRASNTGKNRAVTDYYTAIVQAVKNVKLVGTDGTTTDIVGIPAVNNSKPVVAGYVDAIFFSWIGAPSATITPPTPPAYDCPCAAPKIHLDPCDCGGAGCVCTEQVCDDDDCPLVGKTKAQALAANPKIYCNDTAGTHCEVCQAVGTGPITGPLTLTNPAATTYGTLTNTADDVVLVLANDGTLTITLGELDFNSGQARTGLVAEANPYKGLSGDALRKKVQEVEGIYFFVETDYDTTSETLEDGTTANPYKGLSGDALKTAVEAEEDITFEEDAFDADDYDATSENIYANGSENGIWGGGGVWYALPANFKSYKTITVNYTGTVETGNVASAIFYTESSGTYSPTSLPKKTPQVSPKVGQGSWSNIADTSNTARYKDIAVGESSYTWPVSDFAAAATNGISFQINAWDSNNAPAGGTFKVTSIVLTPADDDD